MVVESCIPCSDIDLLILLEDEDYVAHQDSIEQFLTLLWDIGLKVGSSVRSLESVMHRLNRISPLSPI